MKWFQVDSDTPSDPKIRAVVSRLGAAGMGGLFFLWCHIADHGGRRPGWSIDSHGRPMPLSELIDASKLSDDEFAQLATICTSSGHWLKKPWETRKVIAIPAMVKRADTYTKRRVRTHFEQSSTGVEECSSTRQDIPSPTKEEKKKAVAQAPRRFQPPEDPIDNVSIITKIAHEALTEFADDAKSFADVKDIVKSLCKIRGIDYDSTVVGKAVESALAQRKGRAS